MKRNGWNLPNTPTCYEDTMPQFGQYDGKTYTHRVVEFHNEAAAFCFICEHCHKLVVVSNPDKFVGNTILCDCGQMHTVAKHTYYERIPGEKERNVNYGYYGETYRKFIAYEVAPISVPKRLVYNVSSMPIILSNGDHYTGSDLEKVDVAFMRKMMTRKQFNIVLKTNVKYFNSRALVNAFVAYQSEYDALCEQAKAARVTRITSPLRKFCTAVGKLFLSLGQ